MPPPVPPSPSPSVPPSAVPPPALPPSVLPAPAVPPPATAPDERTGLVTRLLERRSHGVLHTATAVLADTGAFAHPQGNPTVGGASFSDPARARARALGEAAERYAGHLVAGGRLRRTSWERLVGGGADAVDPAALALYGSAQHKRPGFPFAGLRRTDVVDWVAGRDGDGRAVWVPASLVWLAPGEHAAVRGRPAHLPVAAGIAAGPSLRAAREAALAEVVERHALATAWYGGGVFPRLPDPPLPRPRDVELSLHAVPNMLRAPVVLCLAQRADGLLGVGCSLAAGAAASARKAAAEALQSLDAVDEIVGGIPEWERPHGALAPHRADRRYADFYAADLSDATDLVCTLQLLADPRVADAVRARILRPEGGTGSAADLAPWHAPDSAWLRDREPGRALARRGLRPVSVDLTTPDLAAVGLAVARVVVPGLRSTGPAAFPFLGDGADPLPSLPPDPFDGLPVPHA
ncbi:ribosomal protein S12 methylthiotransferase accessory factor [Sinosporangium album]|uniref:Ribosomal protein S12 methylthiotransferase accessory factor n=1 Tax=Sinosporangium album TaxID=504805 RepID=A0A1G7ZT74_9ACTN|nr:YcaO-like family protein [Sinosporangium album]SDH11874.1 ribosomal protein S12 methylthiotransferase accessory factor [Sinosporangium album]